MGRSATESELVEDAIDTPIFERELFAVTDEWFFAEPLDSLPVEEIMKVVCDAVIEIVFFMLLLPLRAVSLRLSSHPSWHFRKYHLP